MNAAARRPAALWAALCVSAAGLAWGFKITADYIGRDVLNPITPIPIALATLLGLAGFYLMRWWGVLIAAGAAGFVCLLSVLWRAPSGFYTMAAYCVPMLVVASAYRQRFKW